MAADFQASARLSPSISLAIASVLVAIGVLRFVTDTLHEYDPDYWQPLGDTWLRYVVRAPSDGSVLGDLNAQWFKVLAIPSGISLVFLRSRLASGTLADNERAFRDWAVRGVWIAVFFLGFTALELHKHLAASSRTVLVVGEDPWLNHVAHVLSAIAAWGLSGRLALVSPREA